jgi:hypothetical protein
LRQQTGRGAGERNDAAKCGQEPLHGRARTKVPAPAKSKG